MGGNLNLQTDAGRRRALASIAAIEVDWLQGITTSEDAMQAISNALKDPATIVADILSDVCMLDADVEESDPDRIIVTHDNLEKILLRHLSGNRT